MADFNALITVLNEKGDQVAFNVRHNESLIDIVYENVTETKENMDLIVSSYLSSEYPLIQSDIELGVYKSSNRKQ